MPAARLSGAGARLSFHRRRGWAQFRNDVAYPRQGS
jgi:hypothetical protein